MRQFIFAVVIVLALGAGLNAADSQVVKSSGNAAAGQGLNQVWDSTGAHRNDGDERCRYTWAKFSAAAGNNDRDEMTACFTLGAGHVVSSKLMHLDGEQLHLLSKMKDIKYIQKKGPVAEYLAGFTDEDGRPHARAIYFNEDLYGGCKISILTDLEKNP